MLCKKCTCKAKMITPTLHYFNLVQLVYIICATPVHYMYKIHAHVRTIHNTFSQVNYIIYGSQRISNTTFNLHLIFT